MISGLVSREKFTLTEIGKMWGHSKSWVSRRLALLTHLNPRIRKDIEAGYLSPRMAQELSRLPQGNEQERVLKIIKRNHMNKDDATRLVTWWLDAGETERKVIEEKGFPGTIKNIEVKDGNILLETVTGYFAKCNTILDRLVYIAQCQKVIDWWPMDSYVCFKDTSEYLDKILTEQLASYKEE